MSWDRVVATTITEHSKNVSDGVKRKDKLVAKLEARGGITYGHGGGSNSDNKDFDWPVKFSEAPLSGMLDQDGFIFQRRNKWKTAKLDWRGYGGSDQMGEMERLQNSNGNTAIIRTFTNLAKDLIKDLTNQFRSEPYIDGNATGNEKRFHGLESFFGTAGGEAATTKFCTPTDTYAGLNTLPQTYGGSWPDGTWPEGSGTSEYDFWSPKIANWSANNWGTSLTTFVGNCQVVLRAMLAHITVNGTTPDLALLTRVMYADFKNSYGTKEQINVARNQAAGLVALGFTDVLNFDGCDVSDEFAVPSNTMYVLTLEEMELQLLNDNQQLFMTKGPEYSIDANAWKVAAYMAGNFKFNSVRGFGKAKNYA
jgi:hypothetical protein